MKISIPTFRKITFIALLALIAIIITGGTVRLTGSGLGCPEWPNCTQGELVSNVSDGQYHDEVEFINRAITGLVSIAVIVAVLGAFFLKPRRKNLIWWSLGLVAGVIAQVLIGALVVETHLRPEIVMVHFLVSMLLVYNAVVLHFKAGQLQAAERPPPINPSLPWLTRLGTLIAIAVIFTGTILTGAGPHSGNAGEDDMLVKRFALDISNLARIHASLVISILALMLLGWFLLHHFHHQSHKRVWNKGKILLLIAVSQGFVGYVQYFSDVPAVLVGFHIAGATLLWTAIIYFHLETCHPTNSIWTKIKTKINSQNE